MSVLVFVFAAAWLYSPMSVINSPGRNARRTMKMTKAMRQMRAILLLTEAGILLLIGLTGAISSIQPESISF